MRACWPRINKESCTTPRSRDRGETSSHHLYEASTPTRRCAVGWVMGGEGQGRTPGSRRRSREDEGTQHHMRFRSPLLCPPPSSARSPGAAPHPRPRSSGPSVHPAPTAAALQASVRPWHGAFPRARTCSTRRRALRKVGPRPAPLAPCPPPPPLGGRGRSTLIPRSVPSGHAVEIPCLDRGLTHRTALAPPSHRHPPPQPRTALLTEESFFDERC